MPLNVPLAHPEPDAKRFIRSYEGLCLALKDNPRLVGAVADRIGGLITKFYRHLLDLDNIVAVFPGDDMGFKTGTLVSPADLRAYILPWHRQFAQMTHDRGLPYFLHSCGNLGSILDDLVENVRIDGKHSFEDAIFPVQDFQARYGDRVAALGGVKGRAFGSPLARGLYPRASTAEVDPRVKPGAPAAVDVNILAAGSKEQIRKRTRDLIEICGARGRYAVGSGNSIPSYVPIANYLAMVDEALGF